MKTDRHTILKLVSEFSFILPNRIAVKCVYVDHTITFIDVKNMVHNHNWAISIITIIIFTNIKLLYGSTIITLFYSCLLKILIMHIIFLFMPNYFPNFVTFHYLIHMHHVLYHLLSTLHINIFQVNHLIIQHIVIPNVKSNLKRYHK